MSLTTHAIAASTPSQGAFRTSARRSNLVAASISACLLISFGVVWASTLTMPFARDYNEGVYLCSARAVLSGHHLFRPTFSSQPPAFVASLRLAFSLFGDSVETGRGFIVVCALVALAALGWISWRLSGPLCAPLAILYLGLAPGFFTNSRTVQAEIPSVAFALLATCAALSFREKPRLHMSALSGVFFSLALLNKLLVFPMVLPLLFVLGARRELWLHEVSSSSGSKVRGQPGSFLAACSFAAAGLAVLALLLSRCDILAAYDQAVRFHLQAHGASASDWRLNAAMLWDSARCSEGFVVLVALGLTFLATRSYFTCGFLCLWIFSSLCFLLWHSPLWEQHLILLIPPFALAGACSILPLRNLAQTSTCGLVAVFALFLPFLTLRREPGDRMVTVRLACATKFGGVSEPFAQFEGEAIQLIQKYTTQEEFIVTDQQMQAFRGQRAVPPELCDTSFVRIRTGYLTAAEAVGFSQGAAMILLWTGRLNGLPAFVRWVRENYVAIAEFAGRTVYLRRDKALRAGFTWSGLRWMQPSVCTKHAPDEPRPFGEGVARRWLRETGDENCPALSGLKPYTGLTQQQRGLQDRAIWLILPRKVCASDGSVAGLLLRSGERRLEVAIDLAPQSSAVVRATWAGSRAAERVQNCGCDYPGRGAS